MITSNADRATGIELALLRRFTRWIPALPHATAVTNRLIKPWYLRKPRPNVVATFRDLLFELNPSEAIDGAMLFHPQLYLRREIRWLETHIRRGDVFVDAGAYLGCFALIAENLGATATAVEASPETFRRLEKSISLNKSRVKALNVGVSDRYETRGFRQQLSGNAGGSAFSDAAGGEPALPCVPLSAIAPDCDVLKIDVEGMEYRVLSAFFPKRRPRMLILEAFGETPALEYCRQSGYELIDRTAENCLLLRT